MNPKVRVIIGIVLWVLAGLCLIVLVRDVSIVSRVDPSTNLGALIRGYRTGSAVTEGVALLVFLIPAYLLTRSQLTRTVPRIALGVGVVAATLLGINASYVLMAEIPRLSY